MKDTHTNDEFLQKRKERQRKIRKRRRRIAVSVILILLIVIGAFLSVTVLFPIKKITVKGSQVYTSAQLIKACESLLGDNLIMASEEKTFENLRSKLPYVASVEFDRSFPDTLNIKVTDAKEYACYKSAGKYYTVSANGWVLNSYSEPPQNMMLIICDKVKCKIGNQLEVTDKELDLEYIKSKIIDSLTKHDIYVNYIEIKDGGFVEAKVEDRFIVDFGQMADIDTKISHLAKMIEELGENVTGKINLRIWNSQNKQAGFVKSDIK